MCDERRFRERKDRDVGCPQGDFSFRSSTYRCALLGPCHFLAPSDVRLCLNESAIHNVNSVNTSMKCCVTFTFAHGHLVVSVTCSACMTGVWARCSQRAGACRRCSFCESFKTRSRRVFLYLSSGCFGSGLLLSTRIQVCLSATLQSSSGWQ